MRNGENKMSIRSYKEIYNEFASMFPELNKMTKSWKGIRFADKHIHITMNDKSTIQFWYFGPKHWALEMSPGGVQ